MIWFSDDAGPWLTCLPDADGMGNGYPGYANAEGGGHGGSPGEDDVGSGYGLGDFGGGGYGSGYE